MRLDSCASCVRNRHAALAATVAAMLLAGTPAASAQVGWLPPPAQISSISGSLGAIFEPQIATDPGGNAVAVWMKSDPAGGLAVYSARYVAATHTWLAPERRSPLGSRARRSRGWPSTPPARRLRCGSSRCRAATARRS